MDDIETMIGKEFCRPLGFPWFIAKWWWALCWCFLTPISVAVSTKMEELIAQELTVLSQEHIAHHGYRAGIDEIVHQ